MKIRRSSFEEAATEYCFITFFLLCTALTTKLYCTTMDFYIFKIQVRFSCVPCAFNLLVQSCTAFTPCFAVQASGLNCTVQVKEPTYKYVRKFCSIAPRRNNNKLDGSTTSQCRTQNVAHQLRKFQDIPFLFQNWFKTGFKPVSNRLKPV